MTVHLQNKNAVTGLQSLKTKIASFCSEGCMSLGSVFAASSYCT